MGFSQSGYYITGNITSHVSSSLGLEVKQAENKEI